MSFWERMFGRKPEMAMPKSEEGQKAMAANLGISPHAENAAKEAATDKAKAAPEEEGADVDTSDL